MRSAGRHDSPRSTSTRRQGFTLMELMTVVVIVGVLSAIAVPSFQKYIYKSRATEALEFLGVIRLREEAYRSEFGAYCPTLTAAQTPTDVASLNTKANLVPVPSGRDPKLFTATTEWQQLGARPSGPVRFGYAVAAGTPANVPAGLGFGSDFWFVARATGDLDGDGTFGIFEIYSASSGMYVGTDANPSLPLDQGYE